MSSPPQHPTAWARTDVPEGMGIGTLLPEPDGFRLEAGETVFAREERFLTRFTVWTDLAWATTRVHAEVLSAAGTETVTLQAQGGHWSDGKGGELRELVGCLDVDIAATPLTNTLPIRRLGLRPGEHRDIAVVWIDIPSLRIRRVRQRYTRHHAENGLELYTYRDPLHGEYRISVDGNGVVVDYERFVRRWSPDP